MSIIELLFPKSASYNESIKISKKFSQYLMKNSNNPIKEFDGEWSYVLDNSIEILHLEYGKFAAFMFSIAKGKDQIFFYNFDRRVIPEDQGIGTELMKMMECGFYFIANQYSLPVCSQFDPFNQTSTIKWLKRFDYKPNEEGEYEKNYLPNKYLKC